MFKNFQTRLQTGRRDKQSDAEALSTSMSSLPLHFRPFTSHHRRIKQESRCTPVQTVRQPEDVKPLLKCQLLCPQHQHFRYHAWTESVVCVTNLTAWSPSVVLINFIYQSQAKNVKNKITIKQQELAAIYMNMNGQAWCHLSLQKQDLH